MPTSTTRFQILSLDGGGIKGLFSAAVLAMLEEDCGIVLTDHFDMIVGTSTGGIIALGLGMGLRPREIVEFYVKQGPAIFGAGPFGGWKHYFQKKFSHDGLMESLQTCFGNQRLADSKKRLVIPSYNLDADDVYLFKTPHHERLKRDYKVPMWKVALATSAAPTYFGCCEEIDNVRLIDGGVWANNPSVVGIAEAVSMLNIPLNAISILNLGTSDPVVHRDASLNDGGLLAWRSAGIAVALRGQSCGAYGQAQHLLGKDRVHRIDPKVPDGLFALDKLSVQGLLSRAASESRNFCPTFDSQFKPHKAAPYTPLYN